MNNYKNYVFEVSTAFIKTDKQICPMFFRGDDENSNFTELVCYMNNNYDLPKFLDICKLTVIALGLKQGVIFYQATLNIFNKEGDGLYIANVSPNELTMEVFDIVDSEIGSIDLADGKGKLGDEWSIIRLYSIDEINNAKKELKLLNIDYNNLINSTSVLDFSEN